MRVCCFSAVKVGGLIRSLHSTAAIMVLSVVVSGFGLNGEFSYGLIERGGLVMWMPHTTLEHNRLWARPLPVLAKCVRCV